MTAVELYSNTMEKGIIGIDQSEYCMVHNMNDSFAEHESTNNSDQ